MPGGLANALPFALILAVTLALSALLHLRFELPARTWVKRRLAKAAA